MTHQTFWLETTSWSWVPVLRLTSSLAQQLTPTQVLVGVAVSTSESSFSVAACSAHLAAA